MHANSRMQRNDCCLFIGRFAGGILALHLVPLPSTASDDHGSSRWMQTSQRIGKKKEYIYNGSKINAPDMSLNDVARDKKKGEKNVRVGHAWELNAGHYKLGNWKLVFCLRNHGVWKSEAAAVELVAQGVIGKRVDEMETGFMMAIDYMI